MILYWCAGFFHYFAYEFDTKNQVALSRVQFDNFAAEAELTSKGLGLKENMWKNNKLFALSIEDPIETGIYARSCGRPCDNRGICCETLPYTCVKHNIRINWACLS